MDHPIIDCPRLGCYPIPKRNLSFRPNRDAGCVSRHRSPSTRRRYARGFALPRVYNLRPIEHAVVARFVSEQRWLDDESIVSTSHRSWRDEVGHLNVSVTIG